LTSAGRRQTIDKGVYFMEIRRVQIVLAAVLVFLATSSLAAPKAQKAPRHGRAGQTIFQDEAATDLGAQISGLHLPAHGALREAMAPREERVGATAITAGGR
jgi:hypothetical protein